MLNRVTLIGKLDESKNIEFKYLKKGGESACFIIAVTKEWHDKDTSEYKSTTTRHRVVVYNKKAVNVLKQVSHNTLLYVEGELNNRSYEDQSKKKCYITEVLLSDFNGTIIILADAKRTNETIASNNPATNSAKTIKESIPAELQYALDDEVPF